MDTLLVHPGRPFTGTLALPGDKSISHRALLFAGLARGTSHLRGLNEGEDCGRTRRALEQLGAIFESRSGTCTVQGMAEPAAGRVLDIDCGNSGTTLRMLSGALAGYPITATYAGDASLSRRPVARVVEPLRLMGARVSASDGDRLPPLRVEGGGLKGIRYASPTSSAQVKSCVLLAGLRAEGETEVTEPGLSRDHTERMLPLWGAPVRREATTASVHGGNALTAAEFNVPADVSAALFWIVAALLLPGSDLTLENVGLNPTRTGALEVLRRMGAVLEIEASDAPGEPRGRIRARHAPLRAANISADEIPGLVDELPILAMAQAAADGESHVSGAAELKVKESDRIEATAAGLRALGIQVETAGDGWRVRGRAGAPFDAGTIESHGDHRIAMSFAIAGLAASGDVRVIDVVPVFTSDPGFFASLGRWQT